MIQNVEDLQSEIRLKVNRARLTVDDTIELLAEDLLTGTYWLDRRKVQPAPRIGIPTEAVWTDFRGTLPMDGGDRATGSMPTPSTRRNKALFFSSTGGFSHPHTSSVYFASVPNVAKKGLNRFCTVQNVHYRLPKSRIQTNLRRDP